jgi:uncharacterized protein YfaS (alpha-2-macroglobulin family)
LAALLIKAQNMKRKFLMQVSLIALFLLTLGFAAAWSKAPVPDDPRAKSQKLMNEGNFREAYDGFLALCLDSSTDSRAVVTDLNNAVQCLNNLGRIDEFDELVEGTIKAHKENWRLLQGAAQAYSQAQHQGFMIAGKYVRGPHRGGGKPVNSVVRDRVRAMQLMNEAVPLAQQDDQKREVAQFYLNFSEILLNHRGIYEAWRLQYLTNLDEMPGYDDGYFSYSDYAGAPVDAEGKPVFHYAPKTWEDSKTDGERWRWCHEQAIENSPDMKNSVHWQFAQFLEQQFGVQSMNVGGWGGGRGFQGPQDDDADKDESGTYALHTLKENETIAKLANGIKRFELPDEFNYIKIYQSIADEPKLGQGEAALNQLAEVFSNRRQYPKAAEYWQRSIKEYGAGPNDWKKLRLEQIVGKWGTFETVSSQPAGSGATVDFRFRNAKKVKFDARAIKVDLLLNDVKAYLKTDPGNRIDWNKVNIQNIGWQIVHQNQEKYLDEAVAAWEMDLEPRDNHWDRRITVTTPLQKAGAYMLTGNVEGGNVSKIILWVADTAIVHKRLDKKQLYFVADAATGKPIPETNLEFFGWQQRHLGGNRYQVTTTNFAEKTSPDGIVIPDPRDLKQEYQWLITARGDKGRLAFMGFEGIWYGENYDQQYNQVKIFTITDRPVYRPEQKVQFKLWIARAQYDQENKSEFAKQSFPIEIYNPKGEKIYSQTLETDEFGGLVGEYELPEDATLGQYSIQVPQQPNVPYTAIGGNSFRVEEYKKPEFEVSVSAPTEPVMLGEKITAKIEAKYYFGAPVTKAKVKYKVLRSSHEQNWYPVAPWDWCYGQGYWWFAYDYPWYSGWNQWVGCVRPMPSWWFHGNQNPPEVVAEVEREIGEDGKIEVEIDTAVDKELHGDSDHKYTITVEVRDESRRTIVGQGDVLVARKPFKVFSWVNRGYYRVGDVVQANFSAQTLDSKPVEGQGELTLYRITYKGGKPIETPVLREKLDTGAEGRAQQQLKASAEGQYRLSYKLTDSKAHTIEGGYIFTIVGEGFDGSDFRFNNVELIPEKGEYNPGETVKMQLNTDRVGSTVLFFVRPTNGVYLEPKVVRMDGKSTVEEIAVVKKDMPNFFVEAVTIAGGKVYSETKEIIVPPEKRVLNVAVSASEPTYKPGEKAKLKVHLTDQTGENFEGSTVLTVYDKSVEYIAGGSNVPDIKEFFWKWRRSHQPQQTDSLARYSGNMTLPNKPGMEFIGVFGATVAEESESLTMLGDASGGGFGGGAALGVKGQSRMRGAATFARGMMMDGAAPEAAKVMAPAAPAPMESAPGASDQLNAGVLRADAVQGEGGEAGGAALIEPTVRTKFADTALWRGAVTTNKNGEAEFELDMPENLTTWKIRTWSMGHGTQVGSGDAEVITRKDLIIRLQAPRFFVQKDEVVLSANVHNYLDAEKEVTVVLEVPGDILKPQTETTVKVKVPAEGEARVDWRCTVLSEGEATVRMKALTDEESDAMEMKMPSYVHGILKMEAWAGTVRPEKESAKLTVNVPAERRVEQSVLEVRYSPSLAMAMVDALPYLAEYPYGCTEQTLNRFLPSVITQNTLLRMNLNLDEIKEKRTNLNAQEIGDDRERAKGWQRFDRNPVFDKEELDRMVKEGLKTLADQQISDGGWGWFSGIGERSYPHTTAVVVHGLQIAKQNDVALVPGMLEKGVEWLKTYQAEQLQWLKNFEEKKKDVPQKEHADALDAFVYMVLVDSDTDNAEMRARLYRDRIELPVYAKGMFGVALDKVGDQEKRDMIVRNIEQFLVQDEENESAYLKLPENNWWWFWYGSEVEANSYYLKLLSRVDAKGEKAPRLVKYLLNNRKHGTYWNSTRDSAVAIESFADYLKASGETEPEMVVELWVDGEKRKEVEINKDNLFTYDNKFVLTGEAVKDGKHEIEVRRRGKGPVYFNAYLTNFTLENFITKAGLEVKVQRKYYKLNPVDKEIKVAGDRGQAVDQKVEKYERELLENLATVKSGDLVEIELEIDSKNDYEYLMFEDFKPAGFEPVDVRSGYSSNGLGAYMELRDNRVTFFVRWLARGKHSVAYRMRAEIPGQFSALPTQAEAMYAPELRGNSDEIKLKVED